MSPPKSVHSDRAQCFESNEFLEFLQCWNVLKSRTTAYHPQGNGQCERFNGMISKTIELRLAQNGKKHGQWESELQFAVMNIRALPSRALNYKSPHECFFSFTRRSTVEQNETAFTSV